MCNTLSFTAYAGQTLERSSEVVHELDGNVEASDMKRSASCESMETRHINTVLSIRLDTNNPICHPAVDVLFLLRFR